MGVLVLSADLISSTLQAIIFGLPSKKNRIINKKIKLLNQIPWYIEVVDRYGNLIIYNQTFRNFLYQKDIEYILKDKNENKAFQEELHQLIIKEKI